MFKNKSILLTLVFSFSIFVGSVYSVFALDTVDANAEGAAAGSETTGGVLTGSSAYETDQYRTYNTKGYPDFDDKFYVSTIKSVLQADDNKDAEAAGAYEDIRQELALTGYETYCLQENVKIEPQYNSKEIIERFLELYPEGVNLRSFSREVLGMDNANFPIWRDLGGKQFLMNSLEEYFGFKDLYVGDAPKAEINSAAINSLLSQRQSCVQGWKTLGAQRRDCDKLEDPSTCELIKRRIPGSGYEVHDIMGLLNDFTGGGWAGGDEKKGEALAVKWCDTIFSEPEDPSKSTLTEAQKAILKPIKDTIINVPTYIDKAYRFGFIIAVVETRQPGNQPIGDFLTENEEESTVIWNFFTKKTQVVPWDEVLVVAFKLPDIGTNKGGGALEKWNDPLDLTRIVLSNKDELALHEEAAKKKRTSTLEAAIAASNQSPDSRAYCYSGDFPSGGGTRSCTVPLPKALTDFVNASVVKCDPKVEPVSEISDLAGLRDPSDTGKIFTKENGGQILINLFLDSTYNVNGLSPDYAAIVPDHEAIKSIWTVTPENWPPKGNDSFVHFYLVYPVGYELSTIEQEISGAFFNKEQIASMGTDPSIVEKFEVTGQTQILEAGKAGWKYTDWPATRAWECGPLKILGIETGLPKPCTKNPSLTAKQEGAKIDVLGGRLSWWLRKVQVALSARSSFAHSYFESCKTMEEFLLGKCAGAADGGGGSGNGNGVELSCDELKQQKAELPTMNKLMKMTCEIANKDSNDAQLLWGLLQIEGSPFLREILKRQNAGSCSGDSCGSMSCADLLTNSCGASNIIGVLIPQCIDPIACSQAAYFIDSTDDPWINESRENPQVACDVATSLDYILRKRKSEKTWLTDQYIAANGSSPSTQQLYYMMAGRNYGVPLENLVQPACGNYDPVQGCGGANYCVCAMDTFKLNCGGGK
ncbi:hypothetical protein KA111_02340 [Candidatus Woesebacteria bacterium]|nr:hypothetical protein [Candidatus Woesebacteria bacterium]